MLKAKKIALVTTGVALAGVLALGGAKVSSADTTSTASATARVNPMSSLVNAIATKFNLKTADVQAVFDAEHANKQAEHQKQFETKLASEVSAGKLTQAQADLIKAKIAELKAKFEANKSSMQSKTPEQIKTEMTAQRDAIKKWATDNNIPLQYLNMRGGPGGKGGPGHGRGPNGAGPMGHGGLAPKAQ